MDWCYRLVNTYVCLLGAGYIYIYMYTYAYMYIYIYGYIYIYTYIYANTYANVHIYVYMYKPIYICVYTYTYMNIPTYIHMYIYIKRKVLECELVDSCGWILSKTWCSTITCLISKYIFSIYLINEFLNTFMCVSRAQAGVWISDLLNFTLCFFVFTP